MLSAQKQLQSFLLPINGINSLQDFTQLLSREKLAKLGDSLVNFIYSVAKTQVLHNATGTKVSDAILCNAYREAERLSSLIKLTGKRDFLADKIETLILVAWLENILSMDEMIDIIRLNLDKSVISNYEGENETAAFAFSCLLDSIADYLKNRFEKAINSAQGT